MFIRSRIVRILSDKFQGNLYYAFIHFIQSQYPEEDQIKYLLDIIEKGLPHNYELLRKCLTDDEQEYVVKQYLPPLEATGESHSVK